MQVIISPQKLIALTSIKSWLWVMTCSLPVLSSHGSPVDSILQFGRAAASRDGRGRSSPLTKLADIIMDTVEGAEDQPTPAQGRELHYFKNPCFRA
jgi:hypothetical protein